MQSEFTIFYTDDDEEDLDFFREIINLIDSRHVVVTQQNGEQLLNALLNPPPTPHIIFLDINMPGMNGFEILKRVRAINKHRELPVVMFSTTNSKEAIQTSMELGANYYVAKSGVFEKLKKSIEHALKINWGTFAPDEKNFVYNLR
jgi:CheY-like chemotaxis protein